MGEILIKLIVIVVICCYVIGFAGYIVGFIGKAYVQLITFFHEGHFIQPTKEEREAKIAKRKEREKIAAKKRKRRQDEEDFWFIYNHFINNDENK